MTNPRITLAGSTLAYVLAAGLVILLHETSHAVAGMTLGAAPVQMPFAVHYDPELSGRGTAIAALTGPAFSLVSGLILMSIRSWRRSGFWGLLFSWFAFLSAEEGFGYFTISGLGAGDTSRALGALDAGPIVYVFCTAFGVAGLFFLAWRWVRHALDFCSDFGQYRIVSMWTWIIGTVVFTALMAVYAALTSGIDPDERFAVLLGAFSLGVFSPLSFIYRGRRRAIGYVDVAPVFTRPALLTGAGILVFMVVLNLILTRGVGW